MTRLELVKMCESGRLVGEKVRTAFYRPGMQIFRSPRECAAAMVAAVRKDVMLKWQEQHHEMELSDGKVTYGFVGVPEW